MKNKFYKNTGIVYHYPCLDGFASYWVADRALRKLGIEPIGIEGKYNEKDKIVSKIKKENIDKLFLVDFSLPKDMIEELLNIGINITVIDHHIGIKDELSTIKHNNFEYIFNNNKSGCLLTWEYFNKEEQPKTLKNISDRDLWKFELEYTKEINAALFSYDYSLALFDELMQDSKRDELIIEGRAISRKQTKDILEMINSSNFVEHINIPCGYAFMVNVPYFYASEMLNTLLTKYRDNYNPELFAIAWTKTNGGYQISFRSDDKGVDVSEIAKHFCGGGHRNASGCYIDDLNKFINELKNLPKKIIDWSK